MRTLAVICVKNAVGRHWKKRRGPKAVIISPDEKEQVRALLLTTALDEPYALVATQLALVTSRIARLDWPSQWPSLFDAITARCHPGVDPLSLRRSHVCDVCDGACAYMHDAAPRSLSTPHRSLSTLHCPTHALSLTFSFTRHSFSLQHTRHSCSPPSRLRRHLATSPLGCACCTAPSRSSAPSGS